MICVASFSVANQCTSRHSARNVPLNDSVRVVGRLAWPGEIDVRPIVIRPQIHALTGELRSVVAEQELWRSSLLSNGIQRSDHIFALQTLAYFDSQTLSCKHIQDRQSAEPSASWSATKSSPHTWLGAVGRNRSRRCSDARRLRRASLAQDRLKN